jgi:hypothetical protein
VIFRVKYFYPIEFGESYEKNWKLAKQIGKGNGKLTHG